MTSRSLHWDALAILRALAEPGTATEIQDRIEATTQVRLPNERAEYLLGHLVGCYHVLRGERGIYVRQAPGAAAVQDADQVQAQARGDGVLL